MTTAFFWDERTFWHTGHGYALTAPVKDLVQPLPDGFPDGPESKRRLKNLIEMSGLVRDLRMQGAPEAPLDDLIRVHSSSYLGAFKKMSDAGGGELGPRAPFGWGGYEIATQSAGLALGALEAVLQSDVDNAYALCRPPGHHCLPEFPNGFCLLANIAVAIEAMRARDLLGRVAVVDWDVHHGNGTEAIFYDRADVLTISLHQERNYPTDTGDVADLGTGPGHGRNLNIPLPPGTGHVGYLEAVDRLVAPALEWFEPEAIIVAAGYDAAAFDPLGRMLATAETFRAMTLRLKDLAGTLCDGRLVLVHEGGYSEVYTPFCAHAAIEVLAASDKKAADPFADVLDQRQPSSAFDAFVGRHIQEIEEYVRDKT
ncbi:MAG: class II histone deacetylase [Pseudomonadota bacterium]